VSVVDEVLKKVVEFGGAVVDTTVSEGMAVIRDPDGQLLELFSDRCCRRCRPRP